MSAALIITTVQLIVSDVSVDFFKINLLLLRHEGVFNKQTLFVSELLFAWRHEFFSRAGG